MGRSEFDILVAKAQADVYDNIIGYPHKPGRKIPVYDGSVNLIKNPDRAHQCSYCRRRMAGDSCEGCGAPR